MWKTLRSVGRALAGVLVISATSSAQSTGAVGGLVKDATGGVLPGVTVEASSAALIEKTRTVVTDETGQYKIVDLRPGVYTVTFALTGFNTVRREGIELTSNFTASVNVEMRVGSVEETITVSGATPVVDIQNVLQQRVMTRDVLDAVPTGKYYQNIGALIPGIVQVGGQTNTSQDVGGSLGNISFTMGIHGGRGRDQQVLVDGMAVTTLARNDTTVMVLQDGNVEELGLQYGVNPAESETGGVRVNLIPKEGGNRFSGTFFGNVTSGGLQSQNLDDDLRQAGLTAPNRSKKQYDANPAIGGPVARDRLWFFSAYRKVLVDNWVGGQYYSQDPTSWIYRADPSRQGFSHLYSHDWNLRLTLQASSKNKVSFHYDYNYSCDCYREASALRSPEAVAYQQFRNNLFQASWSSPLTSRLLLESGVSLLGMADTLDARPESVADSVTEQATGFNYRARQGGVEHDPSRNFNYRASMAYVTGTHALKLGLTWVYSSIKSSRFRSVGDQVSYRLLNGTPNQVTYYATPYNYANFVDPNIGIFAQDQWTLRRLTINGGARLDVFRTSYGAVELAETRWMVPRKFEGADVLKWNDISPRLSASYDLFGTGKTALKVSVSRYVLQQGSDLTNGVNPVNSSNNTSSRTWTDANGDFIVQGDPFNPATNGELGPQSNVNFGRTVFTTFLDSRITEGWGIRPYNWETSAGIQHELLPRVSVNATYYRRWYGNFIVTDNQAYTAADYATYCITAPVDSRLPGGGGNQICGLFDVDPAKFGQVRSLRTKSSNYGDIWEHWNGIDLTVNARIQQGLLLQGGLSTGKTTLDDCEIWTNYPQVGAGSPLQSSGTTASNGSGSVGQFCHQETPFLTQVKFLGAYPLPVWGVQLSATFQSVPGAPRFANYVATNAVIRPSLGRNLAAGANGTVTLNVLSPGSEYNDRINQIDWRLTKELRVRGTRVRGSVDFYNLLNANTVLTSNASYGTTGAAWLVPQVIVPGRIVKLAVQVNY